MLDTGIRNHSLAYPYISPDLPQRESAAPSMR